MMFLYVLHSPAVLGGAEAVLADLYKLNGSSASVR